MYARVRHASVRAYVHVCVCMFAASSAAAGSYSYNSHSCLGCGYLRARTADGRPRPLAATVPEES